MVTAGDILERLPEYQDAWVTIKKNQYVPDIIREICAAHTRYAGYYDQFSSLFYLNRPWDMADLLYTFCKQNIMYREEPKDDQTSAIPTGILIRGFGDCKHYALFNAGIIDSINRLGGIGLKWCYSFAAYNGARDPYHVFVSLWDDDGEIWIDPTPGSAGQNPTLLIRKYVR